MTKKQTTKSERPGSQQASPDALEDQRRQDAASDDSVEPEPEKVEFKKLRSGTLLKLEALEMVSANLKQSAVRLIKGLDRYDVPVSDKAYPSECGRVIGDQLLVIRSTLDHILNEANVDYEHKKVWWEDVYE